MSANLILLSSEDTNTLNCLSRSLTLDGYSVVQASSLSEIEHSLAHLPISIFIYDTKELGIKEKGVLQKAQGLSRDITVILIPSFKSEEIVKALKERLIASFIVKPIDYAVLKCQIDNILSPRNL